MSFPILLAALAPILVSLSDATDLVWAAVAIASWLVFVVDLVVRRHLSPRYLHTGWGRVDLVIVLATAPWFLIPGLASTRLLGVVRLARIARIALASGALRRLASRLNRVAIFGALMVAGCGFIVTKVEGPANGFDNYGDGLWWGIVTLTTVGYGDLVPETVVGRLTGAVLMISGIGIVGVLAGSLASFFHLDAPPGEGAADQAPPPADPEGGEAAATELSQQIALLSNQLSDLQRQLDQLSDRSSRQ